MVLRTNGDDYPELTVKRALFTDGRRTPFGRAFKGAYQDIRADDLLVELLQHQVARHPDWVTHGVDDLLVGCAYPEGEQGYNVARAAALGVGLQVPGATVNRLCASSLEAVTMAAARVRSGWGHLFLTAGIEAMSRVPRRGAGFSESDRVKRICPWPILPWAIRPRKSRSDIRISRDKSKKISQRSATKTPFRPTNEATMPGRSIPIWYRGTNSCGTRWTARKWPACRRPSANRESSPPPPVRH